MIRNGFKHVNENENDFCLSINNEQLHSICGTTDLNVFLKNQQKNFIAHIIRMGANRDVKKLTFNDDKYTKKGKPVKSLLQQVVDDNNVTVDTFCNMAMKKKINEKST